jgi:hypothetical protein
VGVSVPSQAGSRMGPELTARKPKLALAALLGLSLCFTAGFAVDAGAAKKKKKKAPATFAATKTVNGVVTDAPVAGVSTPLDSTITVGKQFKGKLVGDLNVTGIRTTGSAAMAADDLVFRLIGPGGRAVLLIGFQNGIGDVDIGPLTLDDDTRTSICNDVAPTCTDPDRTLLQPFAGTANLIGLGTGDTGPLSSFNRTRMKGTWTLRLWDDNNNGLTNTLIAWGLKITPAKKGS